MMYRLPADRHLHTYIKPWFDETTQHVIPLLLTCKQVYDEAEPVSYNHGLFAPTTERYNPALLFLKIALPNPSFRTHNIIISRKGLEILCSA